MSAHRILIDGVDISEHVQHITVDTTRRYDRPTRDETVGMTVDDLIDNIDELLASRTPESTEGD